MDTERKAVELKDLIMKRRWIEDRIALCPHNPSELEHLLIQLASVKDKIDHGLDIYTAEVFMNRRLATRMESSK